MKNYYLYIISCSDKSFYIGHTENLKQQLIDHHSQKFCYYTGTRLPIKLVFFKNFDSREKAIENEIRIKKWSYEKKQDLISGKIKI